MGRFFANFTSGTAKLGNVNVGESYGASIVMKHGANSLSGAVATENGGYAPEGSEKHGAWIVRLSRSADNVVEFRPYVRIGLAVKIR